MSKEPETLLPEVETDSTALEPIPTVEIVPIDPTPAGILQMISNAVDKGHDPEQLGKLYDLFERMEANAARKAFNVAMLGFQNACPVIRKTKDGYKGAYKYAPLDYVVAAIAPHLEAHGLTYSWENDTTAPEKTIRIITIVRHVDGHHERYTGPAFPCESKTSMMGPQQVVGTTESYAKRYGLLSALGITTGGEDNDAAPVDDTFLTEDQVANLDALIDDTKADRAKFLKFAKVDQIAHIPQSQYRKLVHMLEAKR